MDTLAAIALASEPPHPTALVGNPVQASDSIFSQEMWRSILGVSLYQFLIMIFTILIGPFVFTASAVEGETEASKMQHYTIAFNAFICMQIFNEINCRKLNTAEKNVFENFFNNFTFLIILAL